MQNELLKKTKKKPESKLEIHKLTVFELEVIFQLLNNHRVRLAHLLLPLIFTAKIRDNLIKFIAAHMQKQIYKPDGKQLCIALYLSFIIIYQSINYV